MRGIKKTKERSYPHRSKKTDNKKFLILIHSFLFSYMLHQLVFICFIAPYYYGSLGKTKKRNKPPCLKEFARSYQQF